MAKHYVTFGQSHVHKVNGKILHSNVVARFDANNYTEGRKRAVELFDAAFFTDYHDKQWDEEKQLIYFPGGYVDL